MALGEKKDTLTRDVLDNIKSLLGRKIKILEHCFVRMETKGDKTETRVLVLTPCRIFVFTNKVPSKIDFNIHYLDLQVLESKSITQLTLSAGEKSYTFHTFEDFNQTTDCLITAIVTAIYDLFPGIPVTQVIRKIDVSPAKRLESISSLVHGTSTSELNMPCGNFSRQYACMCDYHGFPYREEVAWDVDTIYTSHSSKELKLRDFDHLDHKDLIPIISALEYNTWFTQLRCSQLKLSHDCCERLLAVVKKSCTLEEIYLDNIGIKGDFAHKLSLALIGNCNSSLHTLDLSHNLIEDKGATHLSSSVAKVNRGLSKLCLSHCGITGKGVTHLSHAFSLNKSLTTSLTHLDLSHNVIKEEINTICNFLAQPNVLTFLNLTNTEISLEPVFGALLRGCTTRLSHLELSRNYFTTKKGKELPPSFKQFFSSSLALRFIALAHCKITPEALKNLLLGLACNETIEDVYLDLSSNVLGNGGCHVLESCIHGVRCLSTLDISENGIDVEMAGVLLSISRNKSLRHLHLNKNFVGLKSKHAAAVLDAFVFLLQEEDCSLQTLSLIDCKLKGELYSLINAVGSNQSLSHLDLTGNLMGDAGARLLSKALQINTCLKTLLIDRNNITLQGFSDIAYALESNKTLRYIPYPLHDIMLASKSGGDRLDSLWRQIQEQLQRNGQPIRAKTCQALRVQQGIILSSTHQLLDRLILQNNEAIRTLQRQATEAKLDEIEETRALLEDAAGAKRLLSKLHTCIDSAQESLSLSSSLEPVAENIQAMLTSQLQAIAENLIRNAQAQCPSVMNSSQLKESIRKLMDDKSVFPLDYVRSALMDQTAVDIISKFNSICVNMATNLSDSVIEELMQSLAKTYKNLVGENLTNQKKRSSTPDVLKSRSRLSSDLSVPESAEEGTVSQSLEHSPTATPQMSGKRKSLHSRKLRPKSVVDYVQGVSADDIPDLVPPVDEAQGEEVANEEEPGLEVEELTELPPKVNKALPPIPLKHLGLSRPRKPKSRMPTRLVPKGGAAMSTSQESLDTEADFSQGLDTFFQTTTVATTTGGSSASLGGSSGRIRGSLGSVSSAELGSPSLESISADSSPLHRPSLANSDDTVSAKEEPTEDPDKGKKNVDETAQKEKKKDSSRGMGVRLLSSIFGKSPSPAPNQDSASAVPTKSPVAKPRTPLATPKETAEVEAQPRVESESEARDVKKKSTTKLGIGVGGNVLAEMKAKQERRVSGIPRQASEESDLSERCDQRSRAEESDNPKPNPLAVKLRPVTTTPEEESKPNILAGIKLRTTGLVSEESAEKTEAKPTLLGGVKLRSTGINFAEANPASNANGGPESETKNDLRNSFSRHRPPPLAPKPRPWSIISPEKQPDETEEEPPALRVRLKPVGGNSISNQDLPAVLGSQRSGEVSAKDVEDQVDRPVDAVNAQVIASSLQFFQLPTGPLLSDLSLEDAVDV